jgi:hypothetical protein
VKSALKVAVNVKYTVKRNKNLTNVVKQVGSDLHLLEPMWRVEVYRSTVYCTKGTICWGHHCGKSKHDSYDSTSLLLDT